jgi:hypothetical protein
MVTKFGLKVPLTASPTFDKSKNFAAFASSVAAVVKAEPRAPMNTWPAPAQDPPSDDDDDDAIGAAAVAMRGDADAWLREKRDTWMQRERLRRQRASAPLRVTPAVRWVAVQWLKVLGKSLSEADQNVFYFILSLTLKKRPLAKRRDGWLPEGRDVERALREGGGVLAEVRGDAAAAMTRLEAQEAEVAAAAEEKRSLEAKLAQRSAHAQKVRSRF